MKDLKISALYGENNNKIKDGLPKQMTTIIHF